MLLGDYSYLNKQQNHAQNVSSLYLLFSTHILTGHTHTGGKTSSPSISTG